MGKRSEPDKLVFCFPYRGVGGVCLLFLRLAEALAQRAEGRKIFLVDYPDGFMARNLRDPKVELIPYHDGSPCPLPEGAILILQSMTPWSIFPSLRVPPGTRVLFWNCYPYNLVPLLPGLRSVMLRNHAVAVALLRTVLRGFRLRMRRFAAQLIAADALVFMDRPNLAVTRQLLGVPIPKPQFVPVAIPAVEARPGHRKRAPLRLVWVGRLADFKVFSLKRALRDARAAAGELGTPVVFDVIGDGPLRHVVETGAGPGPGFEVRFLGDRSPAELEAHLREHADAVFAMGTSALEAARLGIPTVLLDIAYGELPPSYTYRFLDEAQGLSLGDVIGETRRPDDGRGMAETLRQVRDDSGPLAERCLAYFRGHHELGAVAETFLDALDRTTLTWSAIQSGGFLAKPMSYRLLVAGRSWASLRRLVPQGSA